MSSERTLGYFEDIVESIDLIHHYVEGLNKETLGKDEKTRDAVERPIAIIAEAASKIGPDEAQAYAPGIPWPDIRGMRNRVIHDYGSVDIDVVWNTIQGDLGPLREACSAAIDQIQLDLGRSR